MNYEETMTYASNYFRENNIPINWMQYDSWFYEKGRGSGVKYWYPRSNPDYFPSGPHAAYKAHGRQLQCHNRWWAPDNVYAKQNGGDYDFIIEDNDFDIIGKGVYALPDDDRFWMDFFDDVKTWGVESYLQDWMMDTYLFMNATQESVSVARNWLVNMGQAADAHDINIQYCLTLTRCGLTALEIPRVTMARASADYSYNFAQWTIGLTGMITDVLGMAPHKGKGCINRMYNCFGKFFNKNSSCTSEIINLIVFSIPIKYLVFKSLQLVSMKSEIFRPFQ